MSQGKRGMMLEKLIEYSNQTYANKGWALIDKVPTPWTVRYDRRTGRVFQAFPKQKGTVDYIGVSHGRAIAFEAKSTKIATRFPLDNIQEHQVEYLVQFKEQGGIAFMIIDFSKKDEIFYVPIDDLLEWWEGAKNGGRKSIPYEWFNVYCERIKSGNGIALDYLKCCETVK